MFLSLFFLYSLLYALYFAFSPLFCWRMTCLCYPFTAGLLLAWHLSEISPPFPHSTGFLGWSLWDVSSLISPSTFPLLLFRPSFTPHTAHCSVYFFQGPYYSTKKYLVQAATCPMRSFCQERMCHFSSAKKKEKRNYCWWLFSHV